MRPKANRPKCRTCKKELKPHTSIARLMGNVWTTEHGLKEGKGELYSWLTEKGGKIVQVHKIGDDVRNVEYRLPWENGKDGTNNFCTYRCGHEYAIATLEGIPNGTGSPETR